MRTIVWFRGKDLRIADHAPLRDAAAAIERPLAAPKSLPSVPDAVTAATVAIPTCESLGITPNPREPAAGRAFLNELVWREFTHSTLHDRPELLAQPFRADFAETGYPVVDAAARQLLGQGFVHNRRA